jgi:hypothetical protein
VRTFKLWPVLNLHTSTEWLFNVIFAITLEKPDHTGNQGFTLGNPNVIN